MGHADGIAAIKNHAWLRSFPWAELNSKRIRAPFVHQNEDNFDQRNINEEWRDVEDDDFIENELSLQRVSTQTQFSGYYYDLNLAQLAKNREFNDSGLTEAIMKVLGEQEAESQFQDPYEMRNIDTDSSMCTVNSQSLQSLPATRQVQNQIS